MQLGPLRSGRRSSKRLINSECSSAWLERVVRDDEVAGPNPVTPTESSECLPFARRQVQARRPAFSATLKTSSCRLLPTSVFYGGMKQMELTVSEAARQLGVTDGRVRQLCRQYDIGRIVNPRLRLLSTVDVQILKTYVRNPVAKKI